MKKLKTVIASLLVVALVPMIAGCDEETSTPAASQGGNPNSVPQMATSSSVPSMDEDDASKVAEIEIPGEKLSNPTVQFLSEWDLNPAEGQPVSVTLELFQTKFGGRIEHIYTTFNERYSKLATLISADESPDMFSAGDMDVFPKGVVGNQFEPLDPYIDFDSDLWKPMSEVNDLFSINNKHYVGAIDVESDCVMFYNKRTITENGLDDPVELLEKGQWDWDALWKMMDQFCDRSQEKFATDGWWFEGAISLTTGTPYIGMKDGKVVHNLDTANIEKVQDYMLNMKKNDLPFPKGEYGWKVIPKNIADGKTLFYPIGVYALYPYNNIIQDFGAMEDVMFVPMPKCPTADNYYLPARVSGFSLCKGAPNPEGVAAYLNCAMATRDSEVAAEIGKKQAFEEYKWTQEQWDMLEKVNEMTAEHPVVEMYNAVSTTIAEYVNNPMKEGYNSGASWVQTRDSIRQPIQMELDTINEKLKA